MSYIIIKIYETGSIINTARNTRVIMLQMSLTEVSGETLVLGQGRYPDMVRRI